MKKAHHKEHHAKAKKAAGHETGEKMVGKGTGSTRIRSEKGAMKAAKAPKLKMGC